MRFGLLILWCLISMPTLFCQQQASDIRIRLANIDYRHTQNLDDYLAKCQEVRTLLPELDTFHKQAFATIKRLKKEHKDNAEFVRMADFYAALNTKDREGLVLLAEEMSLASQMSALPSLKRAAFFEQQIRPLQKREDQLSQQEVQMVVEAKKKGMPLPDDVSKAVESKK